MIRKASPGANGSGWRRHPLLWAYWLTLRNAVRRFGLDRRRAGLLLGAWGVAAALVAGGLVASHDLTARAFGWLSEYQGLAAVLLGLYAALASNARRDAVAKAHTDSWLAATPIPHQQVHRAQIVTEIMPLIVRCVACGSLLAVFGALAGHAGGVVGAVVAWCVGAMVAGVAAGWWLPRLVRGRVDDDSRYLPTLSRQGALAPSLDALATWPTAQTRTWSRPENARLVLLAALFAVQGGSSAAHGLCVVATWLVGAYLSGLLAALVRSGREAARWLCTTPISFARFAWPLARRVLMYQLIGAIVAGFGMLALGASPGMAVYVCALWLTIVLLVASISLADSHRGRTSGLKLFLSLSAMAGVESRQQGWSIPLALVLVAWQWRRGSHA